MSTDRPRYKLIEEVERLDHYEKGGYHPIKIGDCLNERYKIVHKLGYGSYSTIWLARDRQKSNLVAIKVGRAASDRKEIDILTRLSVSKVNEASSIGRNMIPAMMDHFDLQGPNGTHACFVTTPSRCNLAEAMEASDYEPFPTNVARSIAAQLAMAVAYIHSAGVVHGDLHYKNVLLQFPVGMDEKTDDQLYEEFGAPEPQLVVLEDGQTSLPPGVPSHVYTPVWMAKPSVDLSLRESRILVADFGTSYYPDEEARLESYTPISIRPPEARFEPTTPLGFASDVWSLGCITWKVLGIHHLLGSWIFGPDSAVELQVDALGPLPDEWWDRWDSKTKANSFHGNGEPRLGRGAGDLEQRFQSSIQKPRREAGMELISEDEKDALFEMIKGMLRFRPCERMTAPQVLESRWMREWALPEAKKSWEDE